MDVVDLWQRRDGSRDLSQRSSCKFVDEVFAAVGQDTVCNYHVQSTKLCRVRRTLAEGFAPWSPGYDISIVCTKDSSPPLYFLASTVTSLCLNEVNKETGTLDKHKEPCYSLFLTRMSNISLELPRRLSSIYWEKQGKALFLISHKHNFLCVSTSYQRLSSQSWKTQI